jgi:hypothetical protein
MRAPAPLLALVLCAACSSDPPPRLEPPAAPDGNDPRYAIDGLDDWYLVGDALTAGRDELSLTVTAPGGTRVVDAWIAGAPGVRLDGAGGVFHLEADVGALDPGVHEILLAANGARTAFARLELRRTHALYVLVSTDWDYSDPGDAALDFHDEVHAAHPDVKITHFIGPYSFTDPAVDEAREAELVAWAARMRDEYGDEIGLHIHPYCHFVLTVLDTCVTDQSTVYERGDETGYTIGLWAYGEENFRVLVEAADALFEARGLGKPVTFRAGGWTATIETLRALAANGYVADTSANNWARMEEWIPRPPFVTGTLYEWNMTNWGPIGDTSQPYYPNVEDILSSEAPTLPILEVPDNAIMVDYVTVDEMTEIFEANWDGSPLLQPTTYMMGWHPSRRFGAEERRRIHGLLELADRHLAAHGTGPVVYAPLRDMPRVFPQQPPTAAPR